MVAELQKRVQGT